MYLPRPPIIWSTYDQVHYYNNYLIGSSMRVPSTILPAELSSSLSVLDLLLLSFVTKLTAY